MLGWPHARQFSVWSWARFFPLPSTFDVYDSASSCVQLKFDNRQWESTLEKSRCLHFQVFTHILFPLLIFRCSWQRWSSSVSVFPLKLRLPTQVSVRSCACGIATVISLLQVVGVWSGVLGECRICVWRILLLKNMLKLSICLWSPTFFKWIKSG